jgi:predicted chitinase
VTSPDLVLEEPISWATAFWFWKTNVHSDAGVQAGQFGASTNKINGGLECNPCRGTCNNRFTIYKNVLAAFGSSAVADNSGC